MYWFVGFLIFVGFVLQLDVLGISLTAAIFAIFWIRRVSLPKAISYCSFFLVGNFVGTLQWRISTDAPPVAVHELIYPTIMVVGIFGLIGFLSWFSLKKPTDHKLLIAIIVLTFGLPISLFVSYQFFVDWYARIYAFVCLAAPVVVLAQTWRRPREPHSSG